MKDESTRKDFLIIGLGAFGTHLANAMLEQGVSLVLMDTDEEKLRPFKEIERCTLRVANAAEEGTLDNVIEESQIEYAVVCIGENITASILISLLLKERNILNIYARANTEEHTAILRLIGVTEIIRPELETAQRWARTLVNRGELVVSYQELSSEYVVVEMNATTELFYSTLEELDLRQRYQLNVVGIRRRKETLDDDFRPHFVDELLIPPDPKHKFEEGDRLIVAGKTENVQKFKEYLLKKHS